MSEEYLILHQQNPDMPKIKLFLLFLKGDKRIPEGFRWTISIESKIKAVGFLFKEVKSQIPYCIKEFEYAKKKGYSEGNECLLLALKYEVFLNSIYSLCENLSRVVSFLYPKKDLPQNFNKQKKRFGENPEIDPKYSEILDNFTKWYPEVRAIRDESTHFLSGFITIYGSEYGYFNTPKSERKDTPSEISILNIEAHIEQIYDGLMTFLLEFGNHFINILDKESRIGLPCVLLSSGLMGVKLISLEEYLSGEVGICATPDMDCPIKNSCSAYAKYLELQSNKD